MLTSPDYRLLTRSDVEPAACILAAAFEADPLCAFILPWKLTRRQTLYKFFRAMGEVNIKNQRVYGVGDPLQGVAYWKFPDQPEVSVSVKSLGRFLPLLFTLYPLGLLRARAVVTKIESLHRQHADQPHFYLDNLGVAPSALGQGCASRLLRPFIAMAEAQKVILYTDTVTRENVPFYRRFGFECVEEAPVPGTPITVFALRRPANL